ncbi:hypothetical protein D3C85_388440 [compost metagenome]
MPFNLPQRPKLGISACLLGDPARYNGGHKASRLCSQSLAQYFDFVPLCPEVASSARQSDHPEPEFDEIMAHQLSDICGYILMQRPPSCGLERGKLPQANGHAAEAGDRGIYANVFCAARPDLPLEEEGHLNDPVLRENFLTRVYAYAQWQELCRQGLSHKAIIDFHSRYKYQLMANDPVQYKALGRLLGSVGEHAPEEIGPRYFSTLMAALKKCATRGSHSNVLQHLCGYLKRHLDRDEKAEIQHLIEQYHAGLVPLVVPLTLLKHHFNGHPDRYVAQQAYLQPHPEGLSLRNAL